MGCKSSKDKNQPPPPPTRQEWSEEVRKRDEAAAKDRAANSGIYVLGIRNRQLIDAGVEPGDKIIEINGEQIAGWTFFKVQEKFEHKRKAQTDLEVCFEKTETREYTYFSFDMDKSKGVQLHEGAPSKQQIEQIKLAAEAEERAKKHREAAIGAQGDQVEANDDISNNEWKQRNSPKSSGGRRTRSRGRDGS